MFATPSEQRLPVRPLPLPVPTYTHLGPHHPVSPVSLSELPVRYEDHMDMDRKPSRRSDVSTLTDMSKRPSLSLSRAPASPAWSQSSLASDEGTNESIKSENFVFTEDSSAWPSPLPSCSTSSPVNGSFSSESSDKVLPRLPELDHISLEALASHYASSSADRSRTHRADYALQSTPRSHRDMTPLPPMMDPQQQHHHHRQQQQQHYHHHQHAIPSSSSSHHQHQQPYLLPPSDPLSKPKRRSPVRGTRCNVKYTIEQKDFVDYWRIDRHDRETPWEDVVREYNTLFRGPTRGSGGLQSAWYRENKKIPITDPDGLLLFDENDEPRTTEVPVRAAKGRLHSIKAIGLLSTHPERAIEYPWVTREHKRKIWKIGQARKIQLEAAAAKQRKRAEAEARLTRHAGNGTAGAPDLAPFHGSSLLRVPGGSLCV